MWENKVMLIGFLGKDAERKTSKGGRAFAVLSLATQTGWKDKNEEYQRKVEWHRLIVFGALADYAVNKLKKGDHLYVEGMLVSSQYEKEVGKNKSKMKVPLTNWQVKVRSIRNLRPAKAEESKQTSAAVQNPDADDIPF